MAENVPRQNNAMSDFDYLQEAIYGKLHVTLVISCPKRMEKLEETYNMVVGRIFDIGAKEYYKGKGYNANVTVELPLTDKVRLIGTIDLMIDTYEGIRVIEVKLTDFSEYTITKGLLQVFTYSKMLEKLTNRNVIPELWCFSLNKYAVHKPNYNEKTFNKIIERTFYTWIYLNENKSLPPIPSRLDCTYCKEKFTCPLYGKKIEDLEL